MSRGFARVGLAGLAILIGWGALWVIRPADEAPSRAILRASPPLPEPSGFTLGEPPVVVGAAYFCPFDATYRAYESRARHYYASNHPLLPSARVRVDRCFASDADAEAAGYAAAAPPRGTQLVEGVYLVPVDYDRIIDGACLGAADRLGFAVPCPGLLPNPGPGQPEPDCGQSADLGNSGCVYRDAFLFEQPGFAVPPNYTTAELGGPHPYLIIAAYRGPPPPPDEQLGDEDVRTVLGCPDAQELDSTSLQESFFRGARLVRCPPDYPPPLGAHLIVRWSNDGITYQVSLYGDYPANEALLTAIVGTMQTVGSGTEPKGSR